MTTFLFYFIISCLIIAVLITVHEFGHFLAGRSAGIPSRRIRIVLTDYPPRVVLWHPEKEHWAEAGFEEDMEAFYHYNSESRYLFRFTAGGIFFETLFTISVALIVMAFNQDWLAAHIVLLSLLLNLLYLLVDVPLTSVKGKPWGDIASLWSLSAGKTLVFLLVIFGVRIALLLALDWNWYGIFGN